MKPTPEVKRLFEALQRPLRLAARDGFRELDRIEHLGVALRRATEAIRAVLEGDAALPWRGFLAELQSFEAGDRLTRARLVAQGLRLCAEAQPSTPRSGRASPPRRAPQADLAAPLTTLRGVGPRLAERLASRGLTTVEDLLYFLPLEYVDRRSLTALEDLVEGQHATTCGTIVHVEQRRVRVGQMLEVALAAGEREPPLLHCVWFRSYPGLAQRFRPGEMLVVCGLVQRYRTAHQMAHPDVLGADDAARGVWPRYPQVEGVAPRLLARICEEACQRFAGLVADGVPSEVARAQGLPAQAEALCTLHAVGRELADDEVARLARGEHPAQQRLVFDELFSLQLAVGLRRVAWGTRHALRCALSPSGEASARACFPFALTAAQERVLGEIRGDMDRERPMHRLLQGDVGSGKTVIAFLAACAAMESGLQAAIMAPTEILARQHYQVMEPWARALGRRVALVSAATPRGARESLLALADAGMIHLLVGTHALLSPRVSLPNLGLAVVDEQHRFGVLQRIRLRERPSDQPLPHLLLMTATPIPRSLALALYGDLDLSLLDEKPPGRQPPSTRLFVGQQRAEAYGIVRERLSQGQQAFVVCPLVEESEKLSVADAVSTAKALQQALPEHRVGLVHGRMNAQQRAEVMEAFRRRALHLLVATTVIEVGIDVPEATVMVVEHAERFGLAQLHQLRGRVGRSVEAACCLLLSDASPESPAGERLAAMVRTTDGFEIAEADLTLRGPGELFGTRQAGLPRLRFASLLQHMQLLTLAQQQAQRVLAGDPTLSNPAHQQAREVMERRWDAASLVGEEAG